MILTEYCSSGLHLKKSCSNRGQTHRSNAIVETPCQSPAELAILLPNSSISVVDPKCSKAYIIQLKTCIKQDSLCKLSWCTVVSICACLKPEERQFTPIGPRQGIHFMILLSTPPLPPPVTSPHPSQSVAALPVKTKSECWFARQVQMLDGVSPRRFLCCHLGTPIQARIFSESAVSTWSLSAGLMWSLPSYILLDKLAWLFWFVTLEFQKQDCNISTLLFREGEQISKREDPRQCRLCWIVLGSHYVGPREIFFQKQPDFSEQILQRDKNLRCTSRSSKGENQWEPRRYRTEPNLQQTRHLGCSIPRCFIVMKHTSQHQVP